MKEFERPKTAQEAVLREIRERLLDGRLQPGEAIKPDKFGEQLGVSAVPVREALRILEGEHQVFHRPHRGYIVTELDIKEMKEVFRIRELLEDEAVLQAMPMLNRDCFAILHDAIAEMESPGSSVLGLVMANRRFHFTLYEAAGMPRLMKMINSLWDVAEPRHYRSTLFTSADNQDRINVEHRKIIDALQSGNAELAIEELHLHRKNAIDILEREWTSIAKKQSVS